MWIVLNSRNCERPCANDGIRDVCCFSFPFPFRSRWKSFPMMRARSKVGRRRSFVSAPNNQEQRSSWSQSVCERPKASRATNNCHRYLLPVKPTHYSLPVLFDNSLFLVGILGSTISWWNSLREVLWDLGILRLLDRRKRRNDWSSISASWRRSASVKNVR